MTRSTVISLIPVLVILVGGVYANQASAFSGVPSNIVPDALMEVNAPSEGPATRGIAGWTLLPAK